MKKTILKSFITAFILLVSSGANGQALVWQPICDTPGAFGMHADSDPLWLAAYCDMGQVIGMPSMRIIEYQEAYLNKCGIEEPGDGCLRVGTNLSRSHIFTDIHQNGFGPIYNIFCSGSVNYSYADYQEHFNDIVAAAKAYRDANLPPGSGVPGGIVICTNAMIEWRISQYIVTYDPMAPFTISIEVIYTSVCCELEDSDGGNGIHIP